MPGESSRSFLFVFFRPSFPTSSILPLRSLPLISQLHTDFVFDRFLIAFPLAELLETSLFSTSLLPRRLLLLPYQLPHRAPKPERRHLGSITLVVKIRRTATRGGKRNGGENEDGRESVRTREGASFGGVILRWEDRWLISIGTEGVFTLSLMIDEQTISVSNPVWVEEERMYERESSSTRFSSSSAPLSLQVSELQLFASAGSFSL